VFGKLTLQVGSNSHLELSHHYTDGDRRDVLPRAFRDYLLSSNGTQNPVSAHASRLIWTTMPGGRWSNELIVGYLRLRAECRPEAAYPLIRVRADGGRLTAGTPAACPNSVGQDALALTENLTTALGPHVLTMGAHLDGLRIEDGVLGFGAGIWDFQHLDSLEVGRASHYERALPGPARAGAFEFHAGQIGLYVQDRWRPSRALTLTAGLRVDVAMLPDGIATYVPLKDSLGFDTGRLPSDQPTWSPRLGVNYDVGGRGRTFLRGGIGLFAGRPPYAWIAGGYRFDGIQQLFLSCDGAVVPPFDPIDQPATCANGAPPTPRLSFFDSGVTFPQTLKGAFGIDHRLPGGIVGTVDMVYTRARHQWYISDANLPAPVGVAQGEGGRPLYGTISPTGAASPARPAPTLGQVVRVSDRGGDEAVSVAMQVRKRLADRADVSALYAHTRAKDRMSIASLAPRPQLESTPLDGTVEDRRPRTSYYEIRDRVEVSGTVGLPFRMQLSLLYAGASGTPYTYTIWGDANADGIGASVQHNDIVYVPGDRTDLSLDGNGNAAGVGTPTQQDSVYALVESFIQAEPCLREQRGRLLARNSCRNPWFGTLNARLTKAIPTAGGQSLELSANVYNVLNLLNHQWGQARFTTLAPWVDMMRLVGYDSTAGRGVYQDLLPPRQVLDVDLVSRWQLELSARYVF
jgi:hypothetical protein